MRLFIFLSLFLFPYMLSAQNNNAPSSRDIHDIKITGYLQSQFQLAEAPGAANFSGGDFAADSKSRFMIRRGRLKIDRVDSHSSVVFQIDGTQNGVSLMDAFILLHPPQLEGLHLTAGLFNRPFGYAIIYSSGYRDFPERARVMQTLMPRERDLGGMISFNHPRILPFLTAEVAVMNGSGLSARDYDSKKDLVGNLAFQFDSLANKKIHLGFGASFYKGTVRSHTTTYYKNISGGFKPSTSPTHVDAHLARNYYGANFQFQIDHGFGTTSIKAEYLEGIQPGVAATESIKGPVASTSFSSQPLTDLYLRHFNGYYFWLTQQISKSRFEAIMAYDVYDPNTRVKESQIGLPGNHTTAGDIKFSTFGYGVTYAFNSRVKLTVYNEHVHNEGTALPGYIRDLKDDVFTTRLQYRW